MQTKHELCKVVRDIGSYRCVVDVPFRTFGTTVKFQVPDGYPGAAPDIVVMSTDLSTQQRVELKELLSDLCRGRGHGAQLLLLLVDRAEAWLQATFEGDHAGTGKSAGDEERPRGRRRGDDQPSPSGGSDGWSELDEGDGAARHKSAAKSRGARRAAAQLRQQELEAREGASNKKPPMRTADDVIKRITWDKSLSPGRFAIGYIDRFVGIVEKPFADFSWENLASVDQSVLAIPQHRIEYFKLDGVKVWEKSTRLDHVFGSTGSGTTMADVVAAGKPGIGGAGEAADAAAKAADGGDGDDDAGERRLVGKAGGAEERSPAGRDEKGYDDDEELGTTDDWVADSIQRQQPTRQPTRPSGGFGAQKAKPNYFVCLRITAADVVAKVAALQADLVRRRPELAPHVLPPSRLHVTLAVMQLPVRSPATGRAVGDDEAERTALKALTRAVHQWSRGPIALSVAGVRQFTRRVLYGRVLPSADLDDMAAAVRQNLLDSGVAVCDEEFVPHMTLVKLPVSSARGSRLCVDVTDVAVGSSAGDMPFGDDSVGSLHLCSFLKDDLDVAEFYNSATADLPLPQRVR